MWIEMLETWTDYPHLYLKGMKYDLPLKTLNQIRAKGRRLWRKTKAPWLDASIIPNYGVPEQPAVDSGKGPEVSNEMNETNEDDDKNAGD